MPTTSVSGRKRRMSGSSAAKSTRTSTSGDKALRDVRRRKKTQITALPRNQPFPQQLVATLRYSEIVGIATNIGGVGEYVFRTNSLYDPNYTSTGHQPMYFDQYMTVYNHYTVLKSKITVQSMDLATGKPYVCSIWVDDDATGGITAGSMIAERPGAYSTIVRPADGVIPVLQKTWSAAETFPGDALARNELQGNAGASPTEESYFFIAVDGTTVLANEGVIVRVLIEYTALFDEWKSIAQS